MEFREFAERVLFSRDLGEKLRGPDGPLTDLNPGGAIVAPDIPGRPDDLVPAENSKRSSFPGIDHIESDSDRARLLHFLANHELIAAELMALVLLKFPDAPPKFRQGILKTLLEEQHHTLWYMKRMDSLGVPFGSMPVNGFIWNHIRTMDQPIDFVSRLSLTFEQANLDYSRHYARRFREVGDGTSASIFDKIYRDEIQHVNHGLYWFRQWKSKESTDWQAWNERLPFPLSPMRAKGEIFNEEGRLEAGLTPQFIRELKVYSRSRGRTPDIYFYNPEAEYQMGAPGPYHAPHHTLDLIHDLQMLPAYMCHPDDVVLLNRIPSTSFRLRQENSGFRMPEFELVTGDRNALHVGSGLPGRKLGTFKPWSWAPTTDRLCRILYPDSPWNDGIRTLFSKSWSVRFLHDFLDSPELVSCDGLLISRGDLGVIVGSFDEASEAIHRFRSQGHHRLVVKLPYGSAGGNQLRLWEPELSDRHWNWIRNGLSRQSELVIEPWLERAMDFSVQLEVSEDQSRIIGWAHLVNDHRGQFRAIELPFRSALSRNPEVARFLHGHDSLPFDELFGILVDSLGRQLSAAGYVGPAGIDCFVFRSRDGSLRLKPVVEINPRFTMGRLALEVGRHVQSGRNHSLQLIGLKSIQSRGYATFADFDRDMSEKYPIVRTNHSSPQIQSGYVALTDPSEARATLAVLLVDIDIDDESSVSEV